MASVAPLDQGARFKDGALQPIVAKLDRQSCLSDEDRDALLTLPYHLAVIGRGGFLVREGKETPNCCAILAGFASRQKLSRDGARQILAIHMDGDMVDLQGAALGLIDYAVQALTEVTAVYIPKSALVRLAAQSPRIAAALWAEALIDASIARQWIFNMGRGSAHQRVSHIFCELAVRQNRPIAFEGGPFTMPLTQEQIGDVTGLTAVHVNRTIQKLRAEGLIGNRMQRMSILNWSALKAAAGFDAAYLHQQTPEKSIS